MPSKNAVRLRLWSVQDSNGYEGRADAHGMNDHTLRVLEYDKVAGIVSGFAASEAGRDAVLAFLPAVDAGTVESLLRETSEFIHLLRSNEIPPLDGILDVRGSVQK